MTTRERVLRVLAGSIYEGWASYGEGESLAEAVRRAAEHGHTVDVVHPEHRSGEWSRHEHVWLDGADVADVLRYAREAMAEDAAEAAGLAR